MNRNAVKLGDRMLIAKSNVEANHWRLGNCNNLEFEAIEHAGNYLSDLPFHIDYLQLIDMKAETRVQTRQELVLQASRKAKCIAKDLNIPVLLLSQLNRESENKPGKRPELSNLRESGAIEQDADTVILIHRPEHYGIDENEDGKSSKGRGELIIAKDRNGPTGTVYFKYNSSLTRIAPDVEQQKIPF